MSDDEGNVYPLPPHGRGPSAAQAPDGPVLPCMWCGDLTKVSTLSMLGARCGRCYQRYLHADRNTPDVLPSKAEKVRNPKAWALVLKRRHEEGAALTKAQIDAYRAALSPRVLSTPEG